MELEIVCTRFNGLKTIITSSEESDQSDKGESLIIGGEISTTSPSRVIILEGTDRGELIGTILGILGLGCSHELVKKTTVR